MKKVIILLLSFVLTFHCLFGTSVNVNAAKGSDEDNAIVLTPGKSNTAGAFSSSQKYIFYKFTTKKDSKISVNITASKIELDVEAALYYDKVGNPEIDLGVFEYSSGTKKAQGTLTSKYFLPAGTYFVRLKVSGNVPDGNKVTINAKVSPTAFDDVEPENDKALYAQSIETTGKEYNLLLSDMGAYGCKEIDLEDWFTFTITKKKNVTIKLTPVTEPKSKVTLYLRKALDNGNTVDVDKWTIEEKKLTTTVENVEPGTYFVVVESLRPIGDATSARQFHYKLAVTVPQKVTSLKLNYAKYTLKKGKSVQLKCTVKPNNAINKKLKWTSSNKKVAKVSANGKVTAVGVGTCTITAKTTDGSNKKVTCKITVKKNN